MRKLLTVAIAAISVSATAATLDLASVSTMNFKQLDINTIHSQEKMREIKGEAPRFAVVNEVSEALTAGNVTIANGVYTWRKRITSPNSVSLNFAFTKFKMSKNSSVNIYSTSMDQILTPYTVKDNNPQNELWTAVIMSDDVIIEVNAPVSEINDVQFELGSVNQGFRTFAQPTEKSGSCNIDVVCSEGDNWKNEINSVGVISTGGSTFCTGFMVNNTNNDKTPYFMTANHCKITKRTAASLVVYWNYQSTKCGGRRNGTLSESQSGSQFLASGYKSDFTLVKLNNAPPAASNVQFAGWDRSGDDATTAIAIHHPSTDEKAISFEHDGTTRSGYLDRKADRTHVKVENWDIGTTEPGSSGSPLFDQNHRVIGQLHGGWASCSSATADFYGSMETSWTGNGQVDGSLAPHLDAAGTGATFTDTL